MDSNISSSINLEKEIKPQMPKLPKPKKPINDPEGLGKTIPIQNIGALAGTSDRHEPVIGVVAFVPTFLDSGTIQSTPVYNNYRRSCQNSCYIQGILIVRVVI